MSDYPMLISNKLHSFRNFYSAKLHKKKDFLCPVNKKFTNKLQSFKSFKFYNTENGTS